MSSSLRDRSRSPQPPSGGSTDVESSTEAQALLDQGEGEPATDPQSQEASNDEVDRARQEWQDQLVRWQGISCLVAHALALLGALLVFWWVSILGGLSWTKGKSKQVFNWHPLMMILAFCFMTVAALSFRAPYMYQNSNRQVVKLVHGSSWAVAAIFALVALVAVFKSHNDEKSGFIANLYSFHSWLGIGMVGIYLIQFFAGFFSFGWNYFGFSPLFKAKMLSIHSFLGPFLYMGVTATILLGIQEKEGFVKCAYSVDKADLFPLSHLSKIPPACLVSHALGIVVLATALCTSFALHDFKR